MSPRRKSPARETIEPSAPTPKTPANDAGAATDGEPQAASAPPSTAPTGPALEFSQESSKLLAYKITAFKLFKNISYNYWWDNLATSMGLANSDKGALRKRCSQWRSNPERHWNYIDDYFTQLYDLVFKEKGYSIPEAILKNLDTFFPHHAFHSLYSLMKMTPAHVALIREEVIGPGRANFNVFHYSCQEVGKIVIGNCQIFWDGMAIRTHEKYMVGSTRYELDGYLVQPDHTYRIFSKHNNSNLAQVILLDQLSDRYFGTRHPDRKGQLRRLTGALLDNHENKYFYATRIVLRRIDRDHSRQKPRTADESYIETLDKTVYDSLRQPLQSGREHIAIF